MLIGTATGTPSFIAGLKRHCLTAARALASAFSLSEDLVILMSCTRPSAPMTTQKTVGPFPGSDTGSGFGVSMAFGAVTFDFVFDGSAGASGEGEPDCCAKVAGSRTAAIIRAKSGRFIGRIIQFGASVFVEVRMSEPSTNPAASEQRLPLYVGTSGWAYAIWKPEFYP